MRIGFSSWGILILLVFSCFLTPCSAEQLEFRELGRALELQGPFFVDGKSLYLKNKSSQFLRSKRHGTSLRAFRISNMEEWDDFLNLHPVKYRGEELYPVSITTPNFEEEMIIGIGTQHAGGIGGDGESIEAVIEVLDQNDNNLVITLGEGQKFIDGGCSVIEYTELVAVKKSDKPLKITGIGNAVPVPTFSKHSYKLVTEAETKDLGYGRVCRNGKCYLLVEDSEQK